MQVSAVTQAGPHLGALPPVQLIEDKKTLGEKCAAVVAELKQGEQRRQEREAQMREQHALVSSRGARLRTRPRASARLRARHGLCWGSAGATAWAGQVPAVPLPQLLPTPVFLPVGDQEAQRADERDGEGAQGEVDEREDPEDQGDHGQR